MTQELIMELADSYAQEAKDFGHLSDSVPRKALQDELERLTAELAKERAGHDAMVIYNDQLIAERDNASALKEALEGIMASVAACQKEPKWEAARAALAKARAGMIQGVLK